MTRIFIFALAAAGLAACASDTGIVDNPGQVTVAGLAPSEALGAVDPEQVAANPTIQDGGNVTATQPTNADGTIAVEGAQASAVLSAIDPEKLVDGEKPE